MSEEPEYDPEQCPAPAAGRPATEGEIAWRYFSGKIFAPFRAVRQKLCGLIFGHRPLSNDTGWMIGSKMVDRWCSRCGKMVPMPMAEDPHYDPPPQPSAD